MNKLYVEYLCVKYVISFSKRHIRYAWIAVLLTVDSLPNWVQNRILRTGYCFLQAIDDILDGDAQVEGEPLDIVDGVIEAIQNRQFGNSELMVLTKAFLEDVEKNLGDLYVEKTLELIRIMQKDRKRILEHSIFTAQKLDAHHFETFSLSLELLLAAKKADIISPSDISELILALGWCSTVRDLKQDLMFGIVNIPLEVLEKTPYLKQPYNYEEIINHPCVIEWLINQRHFAKAWLDEFDYKLPNFKNKRGYTVVKIFSRSVRQFANKRFFKLYPHLKGSL